MKLNKRNLVLIIGSLLLVGGLFLLSQVNNSTNKPDDSTTQLRDNNSKIIEKTIRVDNNENHLLLETENYQIIYSGESDSYLIFITGSPFDTYRNQAENNLLKLLEITTQEACLLNIEIATPYFANPEVAGQIFKPGFCK
jgi:hypothetical protein